MHEQWPQVMNRIRVGIAGTGSFVERVHIPSLASHSGATVVAICGRNPEWTAAVARRHSIPRTFTASTNRRSATDREFPLEAFEPRYSHNGRIQVMPAGRSYHEAGTLRMGKDSIASVTDVTGKIHGVQNLYVADAALFPSVGIANPMLTVTGLAYHVADALLRAGSEAVGMPQSA